MNQGTRRSNLQELEKQLLDEIGICRKCRMCVGMCPTYEGWFTQSSMGRLVAINLHFKYGLGSEKELSELLYACTTCRRCEERCRMVSVGVSPADTIIKARELLVKKCRAGEEDRV